MKISLMNNEMFKSLFCNSNNIKYGAKLLSYIFDASYEELLESIKIINPEVNKEKVHSKAQRCDYVVQIDDMICNVEVNCNVSVTTLLRNMVYAGKWFTKDIQVGSNYRFTPTVQVNLNNFAFKNSDKVIETFYMQNEEGILLTDYIIIVNISIPNLRMKWYNQGIESLNELERFVLSLIETDIDIAREIGADDEFMQKGINEQVNLCMTEDLRESYDHELAMQEEYERQGKEENKKETAKRLNELGIEKEIIAKAIEVNSKDLDNYLK